MENIKVKDYIKLLEGLDQEKNIWIIYDDCHIFAPEVATISTNDVEYFGDEGAEDGDYVMRAGC